MSDVPSTMSTQHPDNATPPFFAEGSVVEGEDEIQEAFYVFSHLGCDEQMWDFEGKEGDEYAVKKLLSRYGDYFGENRLGDECRLTVRGPNPDVETSDAKILLEILDSIPRSYDAASLFYDDRDEEPAPPIFEVIIPMVTDATQLALVQEYYSKHVVGGGDRELADGRTLADWVGEFEPDDISAIPLIEDRESMLGAHEILRQHAERYGIDDQRVFLARSDPALNYGTLAADLINKVALQRLHDTATSIGVDVHPILGAGGAPFRGNLTPSNADDLVSAYPGVETFTVQSSFKYDHPADEVREGIETLEANSKGRRPPRIDEDRALETVDDTAQVYQRTVEGLAPVVNTVSEYVPSRRARKLHVGLFGYSREVGETALPRAITFTASLYSIGLPPEVLGASALNGNDVEFIEDVFPNYFGNLRDALRHYNPRSLEVAEGTGVRDEVEEDVEAALDIVDAETDEVHREATDEVIDGLLGGKGAPPEQSVVRAARRRRFLG